MLRRSGATHDVEIQYRDEGLSLGIEKDSLLANRRILDALGAALLLVTEGAGEGLGPHRTACKMENLAEIFLREDSGVGQLGEDVFEEIGRISPAPAQDELTVLAGTWTPRHTGVLKC
jgi:serine phosphatase RsbU (regulator of sigma subunit)